MYIFKTIICSKCEDEKITYNSFNCHAPAHTQILSLGMGIHFHKLIHKWVTSHSTVYTHKLPWLHYASNAQYTHYYTPKVPPLHCHRCLLANYSDVITTWQQLSGNTDFELFRFPGNVE